MSAPASPAGSPAASPADGPTSSVPARLDLGIFARTYRRDSPGEVAAAVAAAGFGLTQLNLSSFGLPTVPAAGAELDLDGIRDAFRGQGVRIWGLSASYNTIDPDPAAQRRQTRAAVALIGRAGQLGAGFVTLCTGSRDPQDMWRRHPGNDDPSAWRDLRATLDELLPAAAASGTRLGIEPEPGNVISDAAKARRLLDELSGDATLTGIVLDPANLVTVQAAPQQQRILATAADLLGDSVVCLHAKDVVSSGYAAAGTGLLDYEAVFRLLDGLPAPVPVIIQDAAEDDVARVCAFLLGHARAQGWAA